MRTDGNPRLREVPLVGELEWADRKLSVLASMATIFALNAVAWAAFLLFAVALAALAQSL